MMRRLWVALIETIQSILGLVFFSYLAWVGYSWYHSSQQFSASMKQYSEERAAQDDKDEALKASNICATPEVAERIIDDINQLSEEGKNNYAANDLKDVTTVTRSESPYHLVCHVTVVASGGMLVIGTFDETKNIAENHLFSFKEEGRHF